MKKSLFNDRVPSYIFQIMRFSTWVYFTIWCLSATAWANNSYGQRAANTNISINLKKVSLQTALQILVSKAGMKLAYADDVLKNNPIIDLNIKNEDLLSSLERLVSPYSLSVTEVDDVIILKKEKNIITKNLQDQKKKVTGTVKDSLGIPLIGVAIKIKDSPSLGTSTDINGNFIINVSENASLVFNYIGFREKTVAVRSKNNIDVILQQADSFLEEVTVVAYGTQKKISLVGAQATIKPAELQLPVRNLTNSLGGRVAGIVSVQRSGEPGGDNADIYIRGISTFSSSNSKPLVLVDGVPRDFSDVDPEDVASFSILKDASATAIYGVRGANGVIIINTKTGTPGKPKFNVRYNESLTRFTQVPEFVDGVTFMNLSNEALTNRGSIPRYAEADIETTRNQTDPELYPNVDWFGALFNDYGANRRVNMNIDGGSDRANYYVATSYFDEKGLYKTEELANYDSQVKYKRYNLTSNLTVKPSNTTTIKLGIQGYLANVNYPGSNSSDIFRGAFYNTPISSPLMYEGGIVADKTLGSVLNPYALLTKTGYANQWKNQLFSNLKVTQELDFITKGLSASGMFSFDSYNLVSLRRTKTPDTWNATGRDSDGNLILQQTNRGTEYLSYSRTNTGSRTIYSEASLNYARSFGNHDLGAMLLYNQSDEINTLAANLESSLPYRFRGIAGRTTYGYKNKYFAELNFGYNGSENFLPEKRYGLFPSIGLGWIISEENLFKPLKEVVQMAKFRFSHGLVGNSNIGGRRFAYLGTVAEYGGAYQFGVTPQAYGGVDIGEYGVDVTWETSKKTNFGLDLWTVKNSLNVQLDVFKEYRDGIFLRRSSLPAYVGMRNNPYGNVGIIENKGIEGTLTYNGKIGEDLTFQLLGNFTFNRNKIVEDDQPNPAYPWLNTKNRKVGQRFGYIALGFFESEEDIANSPFHVGDIRPGDLKFKDLNGDGVINTYDYAPIGYGSVPEIMYGFGLTVGYKAFTLSTLFQGVGNMDIWLNGEGIIPFQVGLSRGNIFTNIDNRWTIENPSQDALYPRLSVGNINSNYTTNSHWIQNGKYLRLKSLQLSYKIPKHLIKRFNIKNADVFFSGVNLLTFSPFKLWDPELGDGGSGYPGGANYPNLATYSLGFNINF